MDVEFILEVFRQARLTNAVHVARTGLEAIDYLLERGEFADREALSAARPRAARSQNIARQWQSAAARNQVTSALKRLATVILIASKGEGDRALGDDLAANSYLVRPIALSDFVAMAGQINDCWLTLNVHPSLNTSALDMLSSRERRVLQLLVEGKPRVAIAQALYLSPITVETYRSRIMLSIAGFAAVRRWGSRRGRVLPAASCHGGG